MTSLVRVRAGGALGGIEAAWRASLLEEEDDSGLPVSDGTALVGIGPFETVTAVLRLGAAPGLGRRRRRRRRLAARPARAGSAGARAVLAARQGPGARRERPGRGARHADQDHARRLQRRRRVRRGRPRRPPPAQRGLRPRTRQRGGRAAGARRPAGGDRRRAGHRGRAAALRHPRAWVHDVGCRGPGAGRAPTPGGTSSRPGSATGSASCSRTPRSSRSASQAPRTPASRPRSCSSGCSQTSRAWRARQTWRCSPPSCGWRLASAAS